MILRILAAVIFCSSFISEKQNKDSIQWNLSGRLSWEDFKAVPPLNATNAALTSSSVSLDYSSNGESLSHTISCNFDKEKSWGRVKNDLILAHEQGHFDVTEIYARRLHRALLQYRYNPRSVSKDVNAIYQTVMQDLQQRQIQYDDETDHSRNIASQKSWLITIDKELKALEKFADYQ